LKLIEKGSNLTMKIPFSSRSILHLAETKLMGIMDVCAVIPHSRVLNHPNIGNFYAFYKPVVNFVVTHFANYV